MIIKYKMNNKIDQFDLNKDCVMDFWTYDKINKRIVIKIWKMIGKSDFFWNEPDKDFLISIVDNEFLEPSFKTILVFLKFVFPQKYEKYNNTMEFWNSNDYSNNVKIDEEYITNVYNSIK
jgi:hypothetical protein